VAQLEHTHYTVYNAMSTIVECPFFAAFEASNAHTHTGTLKVNLLARSLKMT